MSMTFDEFVSKSGGEICGGKVIVGWGANRRVLGAIGDDGVFSYTSEGAQVASSLALGVEADRALADAAAVQAEKDKAKLETGVAE